MVAPPPHVVESSDMLSSGLGGWRRAPPRQSSLDEEEVPEMDAPGGPRKGFSFMSGIRAFGRRLGGKPKDTELGAKGPSYMDRPFDEGGFGPSEGRSKKRGSSSKPRASQSAREGVKAKKKLPAKSKSEKRRGKAREDEEGGGYETPDMEIGYPVLCSPPGHAAGSLEEEEQSQTDRARSAASLKAGSGAGARRTGGAKSGSKGRSVQRPGEQDEDGEGLGRKQSRHGARAPMKRGIDILQEAMEQERPEPRGGKGGPKAPAGGASEGGTRAGGRDAAGQGSSGTMGLEAPRRTRSRELVDADLPAPSRGASSSKSGQSPAGRHEALQEERTGSEDVVPGSSRGGTSQGSMHSFVEASVAGGAEGSARLSSEASVTSVAERKSSDSLPLSDEEDALLADPVSDEEEEDWEDEEGILGVPLRSSRPDWQQDGAPQGEARDWGTRGQSSSGELQPKVQKSASKRQFYSMQFEKGSLRPAAGWASGAGELQGDAGASGGQRGPALAADERGPMARHARPEQKDAQRSLLEGGRGGRGSMAAAAAAAGISPRLVRKPTGWHGTFPSSVSAADLEEMEEDMDGEPPLLLRSQTSRESRRVRWADEPKPKASEQQQLHPGGPGKAGLQPERGSGGARLVGRPDEPEQPAGGRRRGGTGRSVQQSGSAESLAGGGTAGSVRGGKGGRRGVAQEGEERKEVEEDDGNEKGEKGGGTRKGNPGVRTSQQVENRGGMPAARPSSSVSSSERGAGLQRGNAGVQRFDKDNIDTESLEDDGELEEAQRGEGVPYPRSDSRSSRSLHSPRTASSRSKTLVRLTSPRTRKVKVAGVSAGWGPSSEREDEGSVGKLKRAVSGKGVVRVYSSVKAADKPKSKKPSKKSLAEADKLLSEGGAWGVGPEGLVPVPVASAARTDAAPPDKKLTRLLSKLSDEGTMKQKHSRQLERINTLLSADEGGGALGGTPSGSDHEGTVRRTRTDVRDPSDPPFRRTNTGVSSASASQEKQLTRASSKRSSGSVDTASPIPTSQEKQLQRVMTMLASDDDRSHRQRAPPPRAPAHVAEWKERRGATVEEQKLELKRKKASKIVQKIQSEPPPVSPAPASPVPNPGAAQGPAPASRAAAKQQVQELKAAQLIARLMSEPQSQSPSPNTTPPSEDPRLQQRVQRVRSGDHVDLPAQQWAGQTTAAPARVTSDRFSDGGASYGVPRVDSRGQPIWEAPPGSIATSHGLPPQQWGPPQPGQPPAYHQQVLPGQQQQQWVPQGGFQPAGPQMAPGPYPQAPMQQQQQQGGHQQGPPSLQDPSTGYPGGAPQATHPGSAHTQLAPGQQAGMSAAPAALRPASALGIPMQRSSSTAATRPGSVPDRSWEQQQGVAAHPGSSVDQPRGPVAGDDLQQGLDPPGLVASGRTVSLTEQMSRLASTQQEGPRTRRGSQDTESVTSRASTPSGPRKSSFAAARASVIATQQAKVKGPEAPPPSEVDKAWDLVMGSGLIQPVAPDSYMRSSSVPRGLAGMAGQPPAGSTGQQGAPGQPGAMVSIPEFSSRSTTLPKNASTGQGQRSKSGPLGGSQPQVGPVVRPTMLAPSTQGPSQLQMLSGARAGPGPTGPGQPTGPGVPQVDPRWGSPIIHAGPGQVMGANMKVSTEPGPGQPGSGAHGLVRTSSLTQPGGSQRGMPGLAGPAGPNPAGMQASTMPPMGAYAMEQSQRGNVGRSSAPGPQSFGPPSIAALPMAGQMQPAPTGAGMRASMSAMGGPRERERTSSLNSLSIPLSPRKLAQRQGPGQQQVPSEGALSSQQWLVQQQQQQGGAQNQWQMQGPPGGHHQQQWQGVSPQQAWGQGPPVAAQHGAQQQQQWQQQPASNPQQFLQQAPYAPQPSAPQSMQQWPGQGSGQQGVALQMQAQAKEDAAMPATRQASWTGPSSSSSRSSRAADGGFFDFSG